MKTITLKDNSTVAVIIRSASESDIDKLMGLNQKWQKVSLGQNFKDGYVGAAFSKKTFFELINRNQVIVTQFGEDIIGYYLLNDFSKDGVIGRHAGIINSLKSKGKIEQYSNICVGAQAVVDTAFMGSGIRRLMLTKLVDNMRGKYDFLFATIAKDNPRAFKAHTRDGWSVVGEEENLFYVVYKI